MELGLSLNLGNLWLFGGSGSAPPAGGNELTDTEGSPNILVDTEGSPNELTDTEV